MKKLDKTFAGATFICVFGLGLALPTLINQILQGRSWWLTALKLLILSIGLWQLLSVQDLVRKGQGTNKAKNFRTFVPHLIAFLSGFLLAVLLWWVQQV